MSIPAKICDRALFRNFKGLNIGNFAMSGVFDPGGWGRNYTVRILPGGVRSVAEIMQAAQIPPTIVTFVNIILKLA